MQQASQSLQFSACLRNEECVRSVPVKKIEKCPRIKKMKIREFLADSPQLFFTAQKIGGGSGGSIARAPATPTLDPSLEVCKKIWSLSLNGTDIVPVLNEV